MALEDIKLIVSDLDGTLFNSDIENYSISKELKYWIKELKNIGVEFTIATGRPEFSSLWVADELELNVPFITYNGGMIIDRNKNVVYQEDFSLSEWMPLVELVTEEGTTVLFYMDDGIYYTKKTEAVKVYQKKEKVACRFLEGEKMNESRVKKILLIGSNDQNRIHWKNTVPEKLRKTHRYLISEHNYLEIVEKKISKGYALEILRDELGIAHNEVLGIGNQMNDKELLEVSSIGVAVNNACEALKEKADLVTYGKYEKGVIEILEQISTLSKKRSLSYGKMD